MYCDDMGGLGERVGYHPTTLFLDAARVNVITKSIQMESHFHVGFPTVLIHQQVIDAQPSLFDK